MEQVMIYDLISALLLGILIVLFLFISSTKSKKCILCDLCLSLKEEVDGKVICEFCQERNKAFLKV